MKKLMIVCSVLLILISCSAQNNTLPVDSACGQQIAINKTQFAEAPNDVFMLMSVKITGDCLLITVEYSGGCGDAVFNLFDADVIMESYPVQRNIRLSFKDDDSCKSIVTKELSFDLKPIQIAGNDKIKLNLSGWNEQLLYTYTFQAIK